MKSRDLVWGERGGWESYEWISAGWGGMEFSENLAEEALVTRERSRGE